MHNMINLYIQDGTAFVWNADDWFELRATHRICGSLVGALPSHPRQNECLGLPMELLPEEAALLLEKNISEIYELLDLNKELTEAQKQEVKSLEERSAEEQATVWRKRKIDQLTQKLDDIVAGKRRKLLSKGVPENEITLDRDTVLQEEINRIPPLSHDNVLVHIPTEHPWPSEKRKLSVDSLKPSVLEGDGKLRFAVFKDLWERGLYITVGLKFGADFLVYTGDPIQFHAAYMVRCIYDRHGTINPSDLVALGRLSVSVNKLAVLAYFNKEEKVTYQTIQWHDCFNGEGIKT